jgi:nucleotide-binding universal stress UspA family protein
VAKPKVMVALRDAASVESLVTLACQMAEGMGAELTALHVVEVPMATPIEADDEVLDRPEILLGSTVQYVARHAPCRVVVQIPPLRHR